MYRPLLAAGAAAVALFVASCSSTPAETMAPATTSAPASPSETASPSPTMSSSAATVDIVETAIAAGDFTTLTTALTEAGLVETLKGDGPFTVFAPTDAAFEKLPAGTLDKLLKDPKGDLTEILTYHVVPGEVYAADIVEMDGEKIKTLEGDERTVDVSDSGDVALIDDQGNRINVTATDVQASNGVIHVIDGVLMP